MEIAIKKQKRESCNICEMFVKNYKPEICSNCSIDTHICNSCKNEIDTIILNILIPVPIESSNDII